MALRKGYVYPDSGIECPDCSRKFKTPQALMGHQRLKHPLGPPIPQVVGENGDQPEPGASQDSQSEIERLKRKVAELKLRKEEANLQGFQPQKPPADDLMSQAGLGSITQEAATLAQKRALGLDNNPPESWLQQLLRNPEGIKLLVDGLKGILGVSQGNDGLTTALKLLGANDLPELIEKLGNTKAPVGLKLAGIDLSGVNLTPEMFAAILNYQGTQEQIAASREKDRMLGQGIESLAKIISESVLNRIGTGGGGGIGKGFNPDEEQKTTWRCDCGADVVVTDAKPGDVITCDKCGASFEVTSPEPAPPKTKRRQQKPKATEPEPLTVSCPNCGQLINAQGFDIGQEIQCGACEEKFTLISQTEAIEAQTPEPKSD